MANENRQQLQHIRSNQLTSGGTPKLPTAEQIGFGEIAINFATDHETLSIKNYSGDIVTFSADHIINSALTEFSGSVVENEEAIAAAFIQLDEQDSMIVSAITSFSARVVSDEETISTAMTQLNQIVNNHVSDTDIHLSSEDRTKLDGIPGIATSATSGFMSADMVKTLEGWEEKEKVIAQSIAVLGSRSDLVPMPSMTADSQTSSVTITVSGVQDTTHIITVPNNVEEFDINVNNYGNLAVHKIIIDNTANEVSDTTCQVNMGTYYFSGTNIVVGDEIYETLEVSSDIILVNSGENGNSISIKPGKRMEVVLTPYISGQTLDTNFVVMANNGGNGGSGDGSGSGTRIIMRNWSNE